MMTPSFFKLYALDVGLLRRLSRLGASAFTANADRAAKLLGWKAQYPIDEGIRTAIEWGEKRLKLLSWE